VLGLDWNGFRYSFWVLVLFKFRYRSATICLSKYFRRGTAAQAVENLLPKLSTASYPLRKKPTAVSVRSSLGNRRTRMFYTMLQVR
jgi:hypothetical protein